MEHNDWSCEALEAIDTSGLPEMDLPRDDEDLIDWLLAPLEPVTASNGVNSQGESPSASTAPQPNETDPQDEDSSTSNALEPTHKDNLQGEEDEMVWLKRCLSPWSPDAPKASEPAQKDRSQGDEDEMTWLERCLSPW